MKPMWFIERVFVPIEDQYKYLSDEDDDTDDEEWTLGPSKKKRKRNDETIAVSTDVRTKVTNPTLFMKKRRKEKRKTEIVGKTTLLHYLLRLIDSEESSGKKFRKLWILFSILFHRPVM